MEEKKKLEFYGGAWMSFLPFVIFLVLIVLTTFHFGSISDGALWLPAFLALIVAFFFAKNKRQYAETMIAGMASKEAIIPVVCWLFAGVFSRILRESGLAAGVAGIAAGMKLNEMIKKGDFTAEQAKMGYVGAFPYAEVISGYTAFYLGAKSVCPTVTMDVQFTGSWYSVKDEKSVAQNLIAKGCKLISQHADSMGAPSACEEAGVPNVSYNGSTLESCPDTFIVSSRIDWTPYFKYIIAQTIKGEAIVNDWTGTLATGSVVLTNIGGNAAAEGTVEAIVAARTKLANGTLNVFDTANFKVTVTENKNKNATVDENGKLTGYMADVNTDAAYTPDTQVVENGIFKESKFRSAPYFDIQIDGITLITEG